MELADGDHVTSVTVVAAGSGDSEDDTVEA